MRWLNVGAGSGLEAEERRECSEDELELEIDAGLCREGADKPRVRRDCFRG